MKADIEYLNGKMEQIRTENYEKCEGKIKNMEIILKKLENIEEKWINLKQNLKRGREREKFPKKKLTNIEKRKQKM